MVSPWKVILATMIIFGCGVVMGALLIKANTPAAAAVAVEAPHPPAQGSNAPPPFAQIQRLEFLKRMERQLELTPEQRDRIAQIMRESQERSRILWDKIAPQMRDELREVRKEIRQALSKAQVEKFDEMLRGSRPRRLDKGEKPGAADPETTRPAPAPAPVNTN